MTISLRDIYTYVVLFWFFSGAQNGWLKSRYLRLEPQSVLTMLRYACIFNGQHNLDMDSLISRLLPCRNMSAWEEPWYKARYRYISTFLYLSRFSTTLAKWKQTVGRLKRGKKLTEKPSGIQPYYKYRAHQVTISIGLQNHAHLQIRVDPHLCSTYGCPFVRLQYHLVHIAVFASYSAVASTSPFLGSIQSMIKHLTTLEICWRWLY